MNTHLIYIWRWENNTRHWFHIRYIKIDAFTDYETEWQTVPAQQASTVMFEVNEWYLLWCHALFSSYFFLHILLLLPPLHHVLYHSLCSHKECAYLNRCKCQWSTRLAVCKNTFVSCSLPDKHTSQVWFWSRQQCGRIGLLYICTCSPSFQPYSSWERISGWATISLFHTVAW